MKTLRRIGSAFAICAVLFAGPITAQAQFADQATYAGTAGGTANSITLAVDNWDINRAGIVLRFIPSAQNTGATTVLVNGVGSPIPLGKIIGNNLKPLTGGELVPTQIASIIFDGSVWQLQAPTAPAAGAGGYLTPCQVSSPSPVAGCSAGYYVPLNDVTSATTLFYEPVMNSAAPGTVPIFNGGRFATTPVSESQMTLILSAAANTANNVYDVCIFDNAGTPAIGTLPAWAATTGPGSNRGTAAAITQINGIWVNSASTTVINNNVGVSVAANRCTIVASILIDGVNGQVTFNRSYGQNRKWSVWNFYNRLPIYLSAGSPSNWSGVGGWRPVAGNSANSLRTFVGLPEEVIKITGQLTATASTVDSSGKAYSQVGIGVNSTTIPSGLGGSFLTSSAVAFEMLATPTATFVKGPSLGVDIITLLQNEADSNIGLNFYGGYLNNALIATWRG